MMYAFLHNLCNLALWTLLLGAAPALAASYTDGPGNSPTTGMEGGSRHSFGPDREGSRDPRTSLSMPNDAYGNPIVPREPEQKHRHRPRSGAYGGAHGARATQPERPLPEMPGTGWSFK